MVRLYITEICEQPSYDSYLSGLRRSDLGSIQFPIAAGKKVISISLDLNSISLFRRGSATFERAAHNPEGAVTGNALSSFHLMIKLT